MAQRVARVVILASGEGTNAERLIQAAQDRHDMEVVCLASNRSDAGACSRAEALGTPVWTFSKQMMESGELQRRLEDAKVDFVALAGFLLKVPPALVAAFSGRMLNLHPSLLPAFGGKGMYGRHVHSAVAQSLQRGEVDRTGMTLHWVTEEFDEGAAFFQAEVGLDAHADTAESIAGKVTELEAQHYAPQVLRAIAQSLSLSGNPKV
jgi:phosphoribosylglycinamide formyltransferase-1